MASKELRRVGVHKCFFTLYFDAHIECQHCPLKFTLSNFKRSLRRKKSSSPVMSQGSLASWNYFEWLWCLIMQIQCVPHAHKIMWRKACEGVWRRNNAMHGCSHLKFKDELSNPLSINTFYLHFRVCACITKQLVANHWLRSTLISLWLRQLLYQTWVTEGWMEYDRWALVSDSYCSADEFNALYCG